LENSVSHDSTGHRARRIILPLILLAAAAGIGAVLLKTPPHVPKATLEPMAAVVGVANLITEEVEVKVEAYGTVVAARRVRVNPEVSGRIISQPAELMPGGFVEQGEVLFEIDPREYEIAAAQTKADLQVANLEIERIRAGIEVLRSQAAEIEANLEFLRWNANRLGDLSQDSQASQSEYKDAHSRMVSRGAALAALEAQVKEQEKSVASARARADVAENRLAFSQLQLSRTKVVAPFNAMVLDEVVEVGQWVGPSSAAVTLAATEVFWVEASVPIARLGAIRFAIDDSARASRVQVSLETGSEPIVRDGVALRPLGELDPQGRMARVLITIEDPLQLQAGDGDRKRPVLLGSYVHLAIEAGTLEDVISIPRLALRENSRVWVRDAEGKLAIRPVNIVWRRQDDVLVRSTFAPGDRLVVTQLASVVPGMPLNVREADPSVSASRATSTAGDES
jgi:multidrug resistance efflux pump